MLVYRKILCMYEMDDLKPYQIQFPELLTKFR